MVHHSWNHVPDLPNVVGDSWNYVRDLPDIERDSPIHVLDLSYIACDALILVCELLNNSSGIKSRKSNKSIESRFRQFTLPNLPCQEIYTE